MIIISAFSLAFHVSFVFLFAFFGALELLSGMDGKRGAGFRDGIE